MPLLRVGNWYNPWNFDFVITSYSIHYTKLYDKTIICDNESVTFTGTGGVNYNFSVEGVSVQNSASDTYVTTILSNNNNVALEITRNNFV